MPGLGDAGGWSFGGKSNIDFEPEIEYSK